MRLVTFRTDAVERVGALTGNGDVLDLHHAAELLSPSLAPAFLSMQILIDAGEAAREAARLLIEKMPAEAVRTGVDLLAPLPRPVRLRDCSLFLEHMEKALVTWARKLAAEKPDPEAAFAELMASGRFSLKPIFKRQVIYYNADPCSVSGPGADIWWPPTSQWMDYELEWACVVGRTARDVRAEDANAHIFGYTIFNDWSARDVQLEVMDANLGPGEGKDFEGGYGLGPCIATPDEFADPYKLTMTARVNGAEWSRGCTSTMHHRFEDAIVQFSRGKTIYAGEIIGSGTVLSGCGFELGKRLASGDVVELEIDGIGVLRNRVLARSA